MASRRLLNRIYYFTVEDEGILAEAFPKFEQESFCIAYKVHGTDDVFVTSAETKEQMDRHDLPYNLLADEEANRIAIHHTPQSKEELADHEDAVKALVLAHRAIAAWCVGVNGDADLGIAAGNKRGHLFVKGQNVAVVPEDEMVDQLVEWAEFINEHGVDAALARVDLVKAAREAERDRARLLDDKGADANHAAEKIVEIRRTVT